MNVPTAQLQSLSTDDNESSLYDLWESLIAGWRWIVVGAFGGAIAAVVYLVLTPPQYEAMVLVQIGQIGQIDLTEQSETIGQAGYVHFEAPARVVERIMFPAFSDAMIKKLGWASDDPRSQLYERSLKAKIATGTDLIELRVRGLNREEAAGSLNATLEYLSSLHKAVAQPAIASLQTELNRTTADAREAERVLAELERSAQLQRQFAPRDRFSESVVYAQRVAAQETRVGELRRRELRYRKCIAPPGKSATAAFVEPSIPGQPVSPKKLPVLMLGTFSGSFLGMAALLFWFGRQNRHSARNRITDD